MRCTILAVVIFLTGCCSLENEISRCGQKCCAQQCNSRFLGIFPQCYPLKDCAPKVVRAAEFCNNGAADYDNYRMVNYCYIKPHY